jgi:hypothetical protein
LSAPYHRGSTGPRPLKLTFNVSPDRAGRNFPRPSVLVGFELAMRDQLVKPRHADGKHLACRLRAHNQDFVVAQTCAVNTHVLRPCSHKTVRHLAVRQFLKQTGYFPDVITCDPGLRLLSGLEPDPRACCVAPDCMIQGYGLTVMANSDVDGGTPSDLSAGGRRLCERSAGCRVGAAGAADPRAVAGRATAQNRHASRDQRHSLFAGQRLP